MKLEKEGLLNHDVAKLVKNPLLQILSKERQHIFCPADLIFSGFKMLSPFSITVIFVCSLLSYKWKIKRKEIRFRCEYYQCNP